MLFLPFYHSTSHIWSDGAFLNHHILLLFQIILNANHNMEHTASEYHPHHLEGSRVFPAEQFCQLRQRRPKCQSSSISPLVWVANCWAISVPCPFLRRLKEDKALSVTWTAPVQGLWDTRLQVPPWGAADGTRPSALPQIQLLQWGHSCTSTTPRTSAHASKPGSSGQLRQQETPRDTARCYPHPEFSPALGKPNTLLPHSAHSIKNTTQRTHYNHLKYS